MVARGRRTFGGGLPGKNNVWEQATSTILWNEKVRRRSVCGRRVSNGGEGVEEDRPGGGLCQESVRVKHQDVEGGPTRVADLGERNVQEQIEN